MDVSPSDRRNALGDLRALVELARVRNELEVIRGADPYLEMGALYELSLKNAQPPLLLFEDIPGFQPGRRILTNVRFSSVLTGNVSLQSLKAFRANRGSAKEDIPPRVVATGPVMQNVLRDNEID